MPKSSNPKARKSTSRKGAKKTSAPAAAPEPVVVETAPVVEPVVAESAATTEVVNVETESAPTLDDQFKDIVERINQFRAMANTLLADVKRLQKNVGKHVRESNKKNRKRKGVNTSDKKRPPSGFAKPAKISDALCQFLGQPTGTEMARTEVTKYLTKYIKEHQLQDPSNKRIINCDAQLSGLLNVKPTDEVTYFNLQRYMKPHFPPKQTSSA